MMKTDSASVGTASVDLEPVESRRALIVSGITWTAIGQVIDAVLSFAAMLVLVRIIAPAEYGRAAATVGVIALLNTFGAHVFISHAIQLPDREVPDWQAHWSTALYLQLALAASCFAVGFGCRYVTQFRPIALLLQIAAVGFVFDAPNQLSAIMLQRQLDLKRLRLLTSVATAVKLVTTIVLALAGGGAYAIVIGGNVVMGLPFGLHLLFVRRWRPPQGWFRLPRVSTYRAPFAFGARQIASGIVTAVSSACEAAVLPAAIGFQAMGLLNRSRALYTSTGGRVGAVVTESVYPFLPRAASDRDRYAHHATTFMQAMLFVTIPAATYLGLEGPQVSRLLYGTRWTAMDPLIWPGVLSGIAVAVSFAAASVLIAAGRLRTSLLLETAATVVSVAALAVAWAGAGVLAYGWTLAAVEVAAASFALRAASPLLGRGWTHRALYPPVAAAVCASGAVLAAEGLIAPLAVGPRVVVTAMIFAAVAILVCRVLFAAVFASLVRLLAGPRTVPSWIAGDREACA